MAFGLDVWPLRAAAAAVVVEFHCNRETFQTHFATNRQCNEKPWVENKVYSKQKEKGGGLVCRKTFIECPYCGCCGGDLCSGVLFGNFFGTKVTLECDAGGRDRFGHHQLRCGSDGRWQTDNCDKY